MGSALAAGKVGVHDFVSVDMGGTSFDMCLVRHGQPEIKTDWNWRYRYYIGLPMVDVQSVGAGGGSIARVRQGALLVGPESAGSVPGPVCYSRGGTHPTVTDADVVLGYVPADGFAGGRMTSRRRRRAGSAEARGRRPARARRGRRGVGHRADRQRQHGQRHAGVLASHGADPRTLAMIAFGGNGAVHAGPSPPSSASSACSCRRPHPRSRHSACSSPTTWSISCARTWCRSHKSTSVASAA